MESLPEPAPTARSVAAWLGKGAAAVRAGRMAVAEEAFRRAAALDPGDSRALGAHGASLAALGRHAEAEPLLRRAIRLAPSDPSSLVNLGRLLRETGRPREAVEAARAALRLRPDDPEALHGSGQALIDLGRPRAAERDLRRALRAAPTHAAAAADLARLLLPERPAEAIACLKGVIALAPDPALHAALAAAYRVLGNAAAAEEQLREAVRLAPASARARIELGAILVERRRYEAAAEAFAAAATLAPDEPDAPLGLGIAASHRGRFDEAEDALRRAIALRGDHVEAHTSLGDVLRNRGRLAEAETVLRRAVALRPRDPDANVHLAFALLQGGRETEGWARYEARWLASGWRGRGRASPVPAWSGEDLTGRRLLIEAEQGLGDTIQFARFATRVGTAGRVTLRVQAPLRGLLRGLLHGLLHEHPAGLPGAAEVIGPDEQPADRPDYRVALMSLPHRLGLTSRDGAAAPYLRAEPERVRRWRDRLPGDARLRVGLAWAGDPAMAADARRSLSLSALASLCAIDGVAMVSLQVGPSAGQAATSGLALLDPSGERPDFVETAALVAALDLVVSVDTAVAHLAGALGRPVWLLNRFDTCWRWGGSGARTPWYPTMTIFRQGTPGDWRGVVERVERALRSAAAGSGDLAPVPLAG